MAGVATGLGAINLLTNVISIPDFAIQIGAMIGLGVGIDYALFIVTRYRNTLAAGHTPIDAVGIAIDTAGRAVVFAGLTVVVSLLGMLLIGLAFISGLGIGAATTVAITMVASVTLLPALLGLVGDRVEVTRVRGIVAAGLVSIALFRRPSVPASSTSPPPTSSAMWLVVLGASWPSGVPSSLPMRRVVPPRPEKPIRETLAYRWSRVIQAHPWAAHDDRRRHPARSWPPRSSACASASPTRATSREETSTRQAYDLIADGFGPGFNGPLLITAELDGRRSRRPDPRAGRRGRGHRGRRRRRPAVPNDFENPEASEAYLLRVIPTTVTTGRGHRPAGRDPARRRRPDGVDDGMDVSVTGIVAANIDFTSFLSARILVFFGVVLALSFLLLMAVFRSVVVPIKAVIMNVLSIASAYGIVVAIFQWGWFGSLFGIDGAPIEPFIPMMLFAIVFGLSMDYEVFLLSRVKEEYEKTGDAQNSVADGLAATARVITAAAAIMIVVFGSFMFEDNRIIKLFGLGLAMAVFLDASLVRMLLVPATMELLGHRNWLVAEVAGPHHPQPQRRGDRASAAGHSRPRRGRPRPGSGSRPGPGVPTGPDLTVTPF